MDYVVVTNPPRLIQYQPDVYDRILRLEASGILERIDDSEARRTFSVNKDLLQEILDEDFWCSGSIHHHLRWLERDWNTQQEPNQLDLEQKKSNGIQ